MQCMSTEVVYKKLKSALNNRGFKIKSNDEDNNIFIAFNTSNKPVSILILVEMNGRTIQFYSKIKDVVATDRYLKPLLQENNEYKFVKWSINEKKEIVCTIDLFTYENNIKEQDIVSILELIVSSHVRINEKIKLVDQNMSSQKMNYKFWYCLIILLSLPPLISTVYGIFKGGNLNSISINISIPESFNVESCLNKKDKKLAQKLVNPLSTLRMK